MWYAPLRGRRRLVTAIALCLACGWPGWVAAAPFTLGAPVAITGSELGNSGVIGTLHPADLAALGQSIDLSDGNVDFAITDVLVFSMSLSPSATSAVDGLGVGAAANPIIPNPVGAGSFAASGGGELAPSAVAVGPFTTLLGSFDFSSDTLSAGETTVDLFVTFSPEGSALAVGTVANFMISSGADFTVQGTLAEIPEPSSILLLAGALTVLGLRRKR